MIILNETVILDQAIQAEWLEWVKTIHIPAVIGTGYFSSHRILNILNSPNEGVTYCLQYHTDSIDKCTAFEQTEGGHLKNIHLKKFENKLVLFESIMQIVD